MNTTKPTYIIQSFYRGSTEENMGERCSFRRYVIDVYLVGASAKSGCLKLDTNCGFLYYLGNIPREGITSEVIADTERSYYNNTQGLQYFVTKSIEIKWESKTPLDAVGDRVKIARLMMYFSAWGMGYDSIKVTVPEKIASPYEGYVALCDEDEAVVIPNDYKGVKGDEAPLCGRVFGNGMNTASVFLVDSDGDTVERINLECIKDGEAVPFKMSVSEDNYKIRIVSEGFMTYELPVTVSGATELCDIVLAPERLTTESHWMSELSIDFLIDCNKKSRDWELSLEGKGKVTGGSEEAISCAEQFILSYTRNGEYIGPKHYSHISTYNLSDIILCGKSIGEYTVTVAEGDSVALEYAGYLVSSVDELCGRIIGIAPDSAEKREREIVIGNTKRKIAPELEAGKYEICEENGDIFIFYGDEEALEMAVLELSEGIFKKGEATEISLNGECKVLSRFGIMADTHIGERYNWKNYDWLYTTYENFKKAHEESPLDFIVSVGDNIDDGYVNTYAPDYAEYLEKIKALTICDPVNPIEGREEGKIPNYEICGNHDPIGGQLTEDGKLKIRFFKNKLWYNEREDGEKIAHIAFFTDYGGYPLYEVAYCGDYRSYLSYGKVNPQMVDFVEKSIIEAKNAGARHIILYNHFGISQQVGSPCLAETGLFKIASVCEKYGIKLYFNGHEHDKPFSLRRYNEMFDYDVSMTCHKHAVVEITSLRAKVTVYNSTDASVCRRDSIPLCGKGKAISIPVEC